MVTTDEAKTTFNLPPIVTVRDLEAMGVRFSRSYLFSMIKRGLFPAPFALGPSKNGWKKEWIEEWIEQRIATRNQPRDTERSAAAGRASVASRAKRRK